MYKTKKMIIKPDRGLIAWMKTGKSGRVKLAAGSQTRHTPTTDMGQKRAEETKEKGGVHVNAEGEKSIGEANEGIERVEDPLMNCRAKAIAAAGTKQGRECNHLVMRCITWNVRGHRDEKKCSIVGRYLQECGATMVCLQETMWEWCEVRD